MLSAIHTVLFPGLNSSKLTISIIHFTSVYTSHCMGIKKLQSLPWIHEFLHIGSFPSFGGCGGGGRLGSQSISEID